MSMINFHFEINSVVFFKAKPPRSVASTGRTPPPVPARLHHHHYPPAPQSMSRHPPTELSSSDIYHLAVSPSKSRPPTSASSSSFTPSYFTPPLSPSHNSVSFSKFYYEPELDLNDLLPKIPHRLGYYRVVTVERLSTGGFGFSLRKSSIPFKVV